MNIEIRLIRVGELVKYIQSEEFLQADFWPISKKRAISHAMNPRADTEDTALLLAYNSSRFIGYLGIIPETCFIDDLPQRSYWLSCMWVLPEYRREGVALKLLDTAYELGMGNIFITNYISRSKSAFIKTKKYFEFNVLKGLRAYMFFNMEHILINKYPGLKILFPVLFLFDKVLNFFCRIRVFFLVNNLHPTHRFVSFTYLNEEIGKFIEEHQRNSLFRRGTEEFQWMIDFPWVKGKKDNETDAGKYYFSHYCRNFRQWFIKITDDYEKVIGFLMLTSHKGILKTPYIIADEALIPDIAVFILKLMSEYKIPTLVSHHAQLVDQLTKRKKFFLNTRASEKGFITTKQIMDRLKDESHLVYDGDGDNAFT